MPSPSDEDLVRRHLGGDRAAFTLLVERHQRRVYNLCFRMLGRPEDAADAAQETFVSCLRKLRSFRGESAFSTWLHRVALNACHDALRRRSREQPVALDPLDPDAAVGEEPSTEPDPADAASAAVDAHRALQRIPQDYRSVLVLHDVLGLPYDEVAKTLGTPLGTVKSRIHRARVALARALGEPAPGTRPSNLRETVE